MGLFDFTSNMGRSLFGNDEANPAQQILDHIEAENPGVSNLHVSYKDSAVTLAGQADSPEAAQKAILMAGNVKGVSNVISELTFPIPDETAGDLQSESEPVVLADSETVQTDAVYEDGGPYAAALESADVEFYEIQSGDTLSAIAKRYYGNANDYQKIFEANREVIQNPDKIFVGQKIRIPLAEA